MLGLLAVTATVVLVAASGPTPLVPRSEQSFPAWVAGPLHGLLKPLSLAPATTVGWFSLLVVAMLLAYAVALLTVSALSTRVVIVSIVALHVLLLLSPPLQLKDVFNYLGYARLGALHGLNPYTHVVAQAAHDPVYRFTTWHNLTSPYGPLFTAASYPLGLLPLPVAYWLVKLATVLGSLGLLALCWSCARALGRDPRAVVAFVAFNPIYLIWALGGFHNDFFMLDAELGRSRSCCTAAIAPPARRLPWRSRSSSPPCCWRRSCCWRCRPCGAGCPSRSAWRSRPSRSSR